MNFNRVKTIKGQHKKITESIWSKIDYYHFFETKEATFIALRNTSDSLIKNNNYIESLLEVVKFKHAISLQERCKIYAPNVLKEEYSVLLINKI